MPDATFTRPDLTTFTRLDGLGLEVTGQLLEPDRSVLACRVVELDDWCRRCGCQGVPRDTVTRRLVHVPFGWRPTTLLITVRRYRCVECSHVWRQDTTAAAPPRAKISRAGRVEMSSVIDALADGVPKAFVELRKLGRTLTRRACDVLAYFHRPRTSNGPTEARERSPRAPAWPGPRLPQPHPLHRPRTPRSRRIQTTTTPRIVKSR